MNTRHITQGRKENTT